MGKSKKKKHKQVTPEQLIKRSKIGYVKVIGGTGDIRYNK